VRFQNKGQLRSRLLASDQRRLMLLIVGTGIVAVVVVISGKTAWLTEMFSGPLAVAPKPPAVSDALMGSNDLQQDEFNVVPSELSTGSEDYAAMIDKAGARAMESPVVPEDVGPGVVPEILTKTIRDDVIGVLSSETAAWIETLRFAERIRSDGHAALPDGQFALFMDSPQSCRGRAFAIRGRLRRLTRGPLPANAETFGFRSAYDAWISTRDSGNQLIHVVALNADPGLPVTEHTGKAAPEVELTGYFFKREGYAALGKGGAGDLALTPMILAGRIRDLPSEALVSRADEMNPWLTWIGIGLCCGILILVWQFQVSDNNFRGTRTHQLTVAPVKPSFEGVEAVTIHQVLREMEETAQTSTPATSLV